MVVSPTLTTIANIHGLRIDGYPETTSRYNRHTEGRSRLQGAVRRAANHTTKNHANHRHPPDLAIDASEIELAAIGMGIQFVSFFGTIDGLVTVVFCHFEERSDEKSHEYSGDFSLRSK